jgi:hypothetical protein
MRANKYPKSTDVLDYICESITDEGRLELHQVVSLIYAKADVDIILSLLETPALLPISDVEWGYGPADNWDWTDMGYCATMWCARVIHAFKRKPGSTITIGSSKEIFSGDSRQPLWEQDLTSTVTLWNAIKIELLALFCSKDRKYNPLRRKLKLLMGKSQIAITATISASLAVNLGVAPAAILTPISAIVLLGIAHVGKEAFCRKIQDPSVIQREMITNDVIGVTLGQATQSRGEEGRQRSSLIADKPDARTKRGH